MKKSTIAILLTVACLVTLQKTVKAQSTAKDGKNELKLNLAYTIAGFPELNYERIIKDDMSVGVAVLVGLEKKSEYSFGLIPNYRVYFGNKNANGFFIEGNAALISHKENYYTYDFLAYTTYPPSYQPYVAPVRKTYTNFGLGAAAGAKFLTKNGFVGEVFFGVGRLFGSNYRDAYLRSGVTIGKRF